MRSATLLGDVNNFCVKDFSVTCFDHALMLVNIQLYFCHQDRDALRETPKAIMWDDIKRINVEHNLSRISRNAFSTELTDICNDSILFEHEKVDQMATDIICSELCSSTKTKMITIRNG